MKNWIAMCLVAASTAFFVSPQQADAAAAGNTYTVFVDSTVSGEFTAVASFQVATFFLVAENGELGGGTFIEFGPFVFAQGQNEDDYVGEMTAITIGNNFIFGWGEGNIGDQFWFYGF
jgi:hypothetical protein